MTQFIDIGHGSSRRTIAADIRAGEGTPVVWLSGFLSEMASVKGEAMAQWAEKNNRPLIRFDYSGHGQTGGDYSEFTVSDWLEEALAIIPRYVKSRPILVGSSMGGWIAVLVTLALRRSDPDIAPKGLVLLAPAIDFTERLVWDRMPESARRILMQTGEFTIPSEYSEIPYRFTRNFIEDGRNHLVLDGEIKLGCPIGILQGMNDTDVPWQHTCRFADHLACDQVTMTLIRDGTHRLSRDEDIAILRRAVEAL